MDRSGIRMAAVGTEDIADTAVAAADKVVEIGAVDTVDTAGIAAAEDTVRAYRRASGYSRHRGLVPSC